MKKIIRKTVGATDRIGPILGAIVALVGLIMASNAITPRGDSTQSATSQERKGAVVAATKIVGERATQIFNLATARATSGAENPSDATLSTDQSDYPPFSYVRISGTGFQAGETVNLIVVELSPTPAAYEPWDTVADADGNFETTWYIFSDDFIGATMQVTGTGQSSGSTASAIFTDAPNPPASPTPTPCILGAPGNAAGFQIDGDFFSDTDCVPTGGTKDWAGPMGVLLQSGGVVIIPPLGGVSYNPATNAAFVRDDVWCASAIDNSTFAGGQKNSDLIDPTSTHWATATGSGPQKNDIENVYVHTRVDPANSHRWIILAAETRATNGNSFLDFEYNQAGLTYDPAGMIIHGCTNGGTCVGGRTVGDILIVVDYINGGTTPVAGIRVWQSDGTWSDPPMAPAPPFSFIVTNNVDVTAVAPGAAYLPDNSCTASDTTATRQLVEAAIDLSNLNIPALNPCNPAATVNCKTRSSASFTSDLKDFVLFNFVISPPAPCDISGPDGPVCPGTPNLHYCAPAGAASYAWTIEGNGSIVGAADGQCVDVNAGSACNQSFILRVTTTSADNCPNMCSKTVSVQDTTPPTIGGQGANQTVECPATGTFTAPTASDNCGGATVQPLDDTTSGNSCALVTTRSWRAVDACGNTSGTVSQSITRADTTAPTIGSPGGNATIECTATPSFTAPTASDTCNSASVQQVSDTTAAGSCANNFTRTRTWRAVDTCGNTSGAVSQIITVVDTTPPVIGNAGANATIECTATPSFTAPTASDACGGSTVNLISDTTAAGSCANNFTRTRTWDAVDACGNHSVTRAQTITVVDTTPPVIGNAGANATIECTATPSFTAPTASDACGGSTVNLISDTTAAGSCANNFTRTRTWDAVDACGNHSATRTQTITVRDTAPPVIGNAGADATIECTATPSFTAPTASDACGGSTVNFLGETTTAGTCANNRTVARSWNAVDACGNTSATRTQTITVRDTTPPVIGNAGANATIECTATPSFTAPTASDACGGATVNLVSDTTAAGSCANNFTRTRTWDATDACGNHSATRSQTITVVDTTPPVIGNPGANATIECTATPSFTAPTASDACGGATVNLVSDTTAAGSCANNFTRTRTWDATDACGNHSATRSQTITVVDTTPPVIGNAGANGTIECTATPSFTAPTASDACGGATINLISDTTAAGSCANNFTRTRTWDATDACGNHSATRSQTTTVVDTTPPVIGNPGANATIECTATPSFTAPTASDACGGATVNLVSDTTAAGSCANNFTRTRTWDATDACGNHSATRSQTITVADTTAPVIGNPGANATIECTATPSFTAPTASDACDGATVNLISDTTAAGSCANNFSRTRTWDATDACGNHSATRSQTITVVDTTPPVLGDPGANATIECTATPSFTAPTASDACGTSSVRLLSDTTAAGSCANNFSRTRTWDAVDACGNHSAPKSQTITVVDTTPPVIGGQGANATIECPATPVFSPPTASDACGGATVQAVGGDMTAAGTCANNFSVTRRWRAVDACGNTSMGFVSQTITIVDTTTPTIGNAGANATIECTATPSFTAPTASDACGNSTVNFLGETTTAGTCASNYTAARSWNAVDDCGNTSATRTQTITVVDSTAPTIGSPGADTTIECTATPVFSPPTASDTCSAITVVQVSDSTIANCHGDPTLTCYTRCWRAVDDCGNISGTVCQTITAFCPPTVFCTRTQGFYGNANGMFSNPDSCYSGLRSAALVRVLLGDPTFLCNGAPNPNPTTLVVGKPGRSLTITYQTAACITTRLPAGGTPAALPAGLGNVTFDSSCNAGSIPLKNGKFNNVFLGQVITLSLNARLDPNLGGLILHNQFCTVGSGGDTRTVNISQTVLDALDTVYGVHPHTVNELLDLANRALAGQSTGAAKISDINGAVDAINGAFDECRGLLPACPGSTPGNPSQTASPAISPNTGTFRTKVTVRLSCATSGAKIYYTTDGSEPSTASTPYRRAFKIRGAGLHVVKTKAVMTGYSDSEIATANLIVQ